MDKNLTLWIKPHSDTPEAIAATEYTIQALPGGGSFVRKDDELVRDQHGYIMCKVDNPTFIKFAIDQQGYAMDSRIDDADLVRVPQLHEAVAKHGKREDIEELRTILLRHANEAAKPPYLGALLMCLTAYPLIDAQTSRLLAVRTRERDKVREYLSMILQQLRQGDGFELEDIDAEDEISTLEALIADEDPDKAEKALGADIDAAAAEFDKLVEGE